MAQRMHLKLLEASCSAVIKVSSLLNQGAFDPDSIGDDTTISKEPFQHLFGLQASAYSEHFRNLQKNPKPLTP